MTLDILIGMQWGDEGKGRFVDMLSADADIVARFAGGDNAGHTIRIEDKVYKLHLIPSGIIYPQTFGILGGGMVINPRVLLEEMDMLRGAGVKIDPSRMKISHVAQVITPGHRALDAAREASLGDRKIGTTGRGIGPAYEHKARRSNVRFVDMLDPQRFEQGLRRNLAAVNDELSAVYHQPALDIDEIARDYLGYAETLRPYIADVSEILIDALDDDDYVIAEGAQGALLDIDYGTYPFVTSSSTLAANALVGLGIGVRREARVIGVAKVFQTRVGEGPFPTELRDETAVYLRGDGSKQWDEYGTTTGRPRRIGWLDGVMLRHVARTNNVDELALTKLDVLSGLDEIKVCVGYEGVKAGQEFLALETARPVYRSFAGWTGDLQGITSWEDLPVEARVYVEFIEEVSGVPARWVSVGPERNQLIRR
jgi:adenylosuccinate synthase